ncbi:hypothetical protein PCE1_002047 [Barthelona sp. PCE]
MPRIKKFEEGLFVRISQSGGHLSVENNAIKIWDGDVTSYDNIPDALCEKSRLYGHVATEKRLLLDCEGRVFPRGARRAIYDCHLIYESVETGNPGKYTIRMMKEGEEVVEQEINFEQLKPFIRIRIALLNKDHLLITATHESDNYFGEATSAYIFNFDGRHRMLGEYAAYSNNFNSFGMILFSNYTMNRCYEHFVYNFTPDDIDTDYNPNIKTVTGFDEQMAYCANSDCCAMYKFREGFENFLLFDQAGNCRDIVQDFPLLKDAPDATCPSYFFLYRLSTQVLEMVTISNQQFSHISVRNNVLRITKGSLGCDTLVGTHVGIDLNCIEYQNSNYEWIGRNVFTGLFDRVQFMREDVILLSIEDISPERVGSNGFIECMNSGYVKHFLLLRHDVVMTLNYALNCKITKVYPSEGGDALVVYYKMYESSTGYTDMQKVVFKIDGTVLHEELPSLYQSDRIIQGKPFSVYHGAEGVRVSLGTTLLYEEDNTGAGTVQSVSSGSNDTIAFEFKGIVHFLRISQEGFVLQHLQMDGTRVRLCHWFIAEDTQLALVECDSRILLYSVNWEVGRLSQPCDITLLCSHGFMGNQQIFINESAILFDLNTHTISLDCDGDPFVKNSVDSLPSCSIDGIGYLPRRDVGQKVTFDDDTKTYDVVEYDYESNVENITHHHVPTFVANADVFSFSIPIQEVN